MTADTTTPRSRRALLTAAAGGAAAAAAASLAHAVPSAAGTLPPVELGLQRQHRGERDQDHQPERR